MIKNNHLGLKKLILDLGVSIFFYLWAPRSQDLPLILARFLTYAATLRICLDLHGIRGLGLGLDIEDPIFIRSSFFLALWVTFFLFLINVGAWRS